MLTLDDDKWVRLVAKLNAMTQDGQLQWEGPETWKTDAGRTVSDYRAAYKERFFRLRRLAALGSMKLRHTLAIVDASNDLLFQIPDVVGIADLYQTVIYQRAGIKDMLDDLLKDDV